MDKLKVEKGKEKKPEYLTNLYHRIASVLDKMFCDNSVTVL